MPFLLNTINGILNRLILHLHTLLSFPKSLTSYRTARYAVFLRPFVGPAFFVREAWFPES